MNVRNDTVMQMEPEKNQDGLDNAALYVEKYSNYKTSIFTHFQL